MTFISSYASIAGSVLTLTLIPVGILAFTVVMWVVAALLAVIQLDTKRLKGYDESPIMVGLVGIVTSFFYFWAIFVNWVYDAARSIMSMILRPAFLVAIVAAFVAVFVDFYHPYLFSLWDWINNCWWSPIWRQIILAILNPLRLFYTVFALPVGIAWRIYRWFMFGTLILIAQCSGANFDQVTIHTAGAIVEFADSLTDWQVCSIDNVTQSVAYCIANNPWNTTEVWKEIGNAIAAFEAPLDCVCSVLGDILGWFFTWVQDPNLHQALDHWWNWIMWYVFRMWVLLFSFGGPLTTGPAYFHLDEAVRLSGVTVDNAAAFLLHDFAGIMTSVTCIDSLDYTCTAQGGPLFCVANPIGLDKTVTCNSTSFMICKDAAFNGPTNCNNASTQCQAEIGMTCSTFLNSTFGNASTPITCSAPAGIICTKPDDVHITCAKPTIYTPKIGCILAGIFRLTLVQPLNQTSAIFTDLIFARHIGERDGYLFFDTSRYRLLFDELFACICDTLAAFWQWAFLGVFLPEITLIIEAGCCSVASLVKFVVYFALFLEDWFTRLIYFCIFEEVFTGSFDNLLCYLGNTDECGANPAPETGFPQEAWDAIGTAFVNFWNCLCVFLGLFWEPLGCICSEIPEFFLSFLDFAAKELVTTIIAIVGGGRHFEQTLKPAWVRFANSFTAMVFCLGDGIRELSILFGDATCQPLDSNPFCCLADALEQTTVLIFQFFYMIILVSLRIEDWSNVNSFITIASAFEIDTIINSHSAEVAVGAWLCLTTVVSPSTPCKNFGSTGTSSNPGQSIGTNTILLGRTFTALILSVLDLIIDLLTGRLITNAPNSTNGIVTILKRIGSQTVAFLLALANVVDCNIPGFGSIIRITADFILTFTSGQVLSTIIAPFICIAKMFGYIIQGDFGSAIQAWLQCIVLWLAFAWEISVQLIIRIMQYAFNFFNNWIIDPINKVFNVLYNVCKGFTAGSSKCNKLKDLIPKLNAASIFSNIPNPFTALANSGEFKFRKLEKFVNSTPVEQGEQLLDFYNHITNDYVQKWRKDFNLRESSNEETPMSSVKPSHASKAHLWDLSHKHFSGFNLTQSLGEDFHEYIKSQSTFENRATPANHAANSTITFTYWQLYYLKNGVLPPLMPKTAEEFDAVPGFKPLAKDEVANISANTPLTSDSDDDIDHILANAQEVTRRISHSSNITGPEFNDSFCVNVLSQYANQSTPLSKLEIITLTDCIQWYIQGELVKHNVWQLHEIPAHAIFSPFNLGQIAALIVRNMFLYIQYNIGVRMEMEKVLNDLQKVYNQGLLPENMSLEGERLRILEHSPKSLDEYLHTTGASYPDLTKRIYRAISISINDIVHGTNAFLDSEGDWGNLLQDLMSNGEYFNVEVEDFILTNDPTIYAKQVREALDIVSQKYDETPFFETAANGAWTAANILWMKMYVTGQHYWNQGRSAEEIFAPRTEKAVRTRLSLRYLMDRLTRKNPAVEAVREELQDHGIDPTETRVQEILRYKARELPLDVPLKRMHLATHRDPQEIHASSSLSAFPSCQYKDNGHGSPLSSRAMATCSATLLSIQELFDVYAPTQANNDADDDNNDSENTLPENIIHSARLRAKGPFPLVKGMDEQSGSFHLRRNTRSPRASDPATCLQANSYCTPCNYCVTCLWLDRYIDVVTDSVDIAIEYYSPGGVYTQSLAAYNEFTQDLQEETAFARRSQLRTTKASSLSLKVTPKWLSRRGITIAEFSGSGVEALRRAAAKSPHIWTSLRNGVGAIPGAFSDRFLRRAEILLSDVDAQDLAIDNQLRMKSESISPFNNKNNKRDPVDPGEFDELFCGLPALDFPTDALFPTTVDPRNRSSVTGYNESLNAQFLDFVETIIPAVALAPIYDVLESVRDFFDPNIDGGFASNFLSTGSFCNHRGVLLCQSGVGFKKAFTDTYVVLIVLTILFAIVYPPLMPLIMTLWVLSIPIVLFSAYTYNFLLCGFTLPGCLADDIFDLLESIFPVCVPWPDGMIVNPNVPCAACTTWVEMNSCQSIGFLDGVDDYFWLFNAYFKEAIQGLNDASTQLLANPTQVPDTFLGRILYTCPVIAERAVKWAVVAEGQQTSFQTMCFWTTVWWNTAILVFVIVPIVALIFFGLYFLLSFIIAYPAILAWLGFIMFAVFKQSLSAATLTEDERNLADEDYARLKADEENS